MIGKNLLVRGIESSFDWFWLADTAVTGKGDAETTAFGGFTFDRKSGPVFAARMLDNGQAQPRTGSVGPAPGAAVITIGNYRYLARVDARGSEDAVHAAVVRCVRERLGLLQQPAR